jgi:hypothetical protein
MKFFRLLERRILAKARGVIGVGLKHLPPPLILDHVIDTNVNPHLFTKFFLIISHHAVGSLS